VDRHSLEVRFYERGAGVTMSSGTGSTGAAAAALHRGLVESPISVSTQGGALQIRLNREIFMTGPAEIVARGVFFFP
jgi:diaminopimelate epimerase